VLLLRERDRTAGSEAPSEEASSTATVEAGTVDEVADVVEKMLLDTSGHTSTLAQDEDGTREGGA
jgi:hypothetical protein